MTTLKTALETLAAKSVAIKTAKTGKDNAAQSVHAATDAAIIAAVNVGILCNGAVPDKRVLKKQFPDMDVLDNIQSNLLTYARLIMQGQGMTVTTKDDSYEVSLDTLANAPMRLSTVATSLRSAFQEQEQEQERQAELSRATAQKILATDAGFQARYETPEKLEQAVDVATDAEAHNEPHNEELLKAWRAIYSKSEENLAEEKARQDAEATAQQIITLMEGLSVDASNGPASAALAALLNIAEDEEATLKVAA